MDPAGEMWSVVSESPTFTRTRAPSMFPPTTASSSPFEERRLLHVRRRGIPVVHRSRGRRERRPMLVAVPDPAVLRLELPAIGRRADRLGDLLGTGPDVGERPRGRRRRRRSAPCEVDVDAPGQRVRDAERRRAQVARADLRMDASLEVPVARQDGDDVELLVVDRRADVVRQRPGVADARRAPVPDEREPELLQVRRETRLIQVFGHHARARRQARLDPRLRLQPGLDRVLRQETRGHHDRWVRRVRAARDRGDDDRPSRSSFG